MDRFSAKNLRKHLSSKKHVLHCKTFLTILRQILTRRFLESGNWLSKMCAWLWYKSAKSKSTEPTSRSKSSNLNSNRANWWLESDTPPNYYVLLCRCFLSSLAKMKFHEHKNTNHESCDLPEVKLRLFNCSFSTFAKNRQN